MKSVTKAEYHLPGLFEFYDFYRVFLPVFHRYREYFYDWCSIGSLYGAPAGCLWSGGRRGGGNRDPRDVLALVHDCGISARLTFSNSLLKEEHLSDLKCNALCQMLKKGDGVIVHSDLLLQYLHRTYPDLYFVSSTTKVLTDFADFRKELAREEYRYAVADFRLNRRFAELEQLPQALKDKTEFLCNECCDFSCRERKACYEAVSADVLGIPGREHVCHAPYGFQGYVFSRAMENPGFISVGDIQDKYMPMGFRNFKIEGRSLGTAYLLEFILFYMTKPEDRLKVREKIYLNDALDLF